MSSVKMVSLLRSFGCDSSGTAVWDGPWGICVSGQFVYVTDLDGYNVSVFTTTGDYITSFGQHGKAFGEFNTPVGVCTDLDGFVYVADFNTSKVQCF